MIIREPKVYLIGHSGTTRLAIDRFLRDHGHEASNFGDHHYDDADQIICTGSRLCYDSFSKGRDPEEHLRHVIASGHGSVLEHAGFSLLFAGVSRSLTHELIRHRHFSFSEQSQRYIEVPGNFVVPPLLPEDRWAVWHTRQLVAHRNYTQEIQILLERGLTRKEAHGAARSYLPECTETRILVTGNLRAWRGFFDQRISPHADAEIRRLAEAVFDTIKPHTQALDDYDVSRVTPNKKV